MPNDNAVTNVKRMEWPAKGELVIRPLFVGISIIFLTFSPAL